MTLSPQEILRQYGIAYEDSGRYYTTCPHCSKDRRKPTAKCLGVTIDAEGVRFGCNHCGWTGPEKGRGNGKAADAHDLTTYDYVDADGKLLFQKVRNPPGSKNRFTVRRPDGRGGWIYDLKGIPNPRPLYRWPEIVKAAAEDREIAICEGEKDADNLWRLGIPATCNFDGTTDVIKNPKAKQKWKADYSEALRGARIVVFNDNDPPGYAHADNICKLSLGIAKRVRRLDLKNHWPEIPPGGDVSDWLARGHSRQDLDALIEQATDYAPQVPQASGGLEDEIALAFAAQHADDFRYVARTAQWKRWTGSRWQDEHTLGAFDVSRALCREAGDAKAKTVAAVVALARTDRRIAATIEQWDANPDLLNCGAVTVDLKTGQERPPDRLDYCTKQTSIAPAPPGTPCDLFFNFLDRVTGKDNELISFLQRLLGYSLTGHGYEHVFAFFYGTGANGKGTFIRTISTILNDYCTV
jgi:putative DNA primase/helicase